MHLSFTMKHVPFVSILVVYGPISTKSGMKVGLWTLMSMALVQHVSKMSVPLALSHCDRNLTLLTRAPRERQGPSNYNNHMYAQRVCSTTFIDYQFQRMKLRQCCYISLSNLQHILCEEGFPKNGPLWLIFHKKYGINIEPATEDALRVSCDNMFLGRFPSNRVLFFKKLKLSEGKITFE